MFDFPHKYYPRERIQTVSPKSALRMYNDDPECEPCYNWNINIHLR